MSIFIIEIRDKTYLGKNFREHSGNVTLVFSVMCPVVFRVEPDRFTD